MLSRSQLLTLAQSLRGTKTLSVYLTGWTDDPAQRDAWRIELKNALEAQREQLRQASHAEREDYDACVRRLWTHLDTINGVLGEPGWVGFVTTEGVSHAEAVPVTLPLRVDWGEGLQLAPYIRVFKHRIPAVVAVVDAKHARLYRYAGHRLAALGSIHAHKHVEAPQHMGSMPAAGFHTGTRGSTGTDEADHARLVGRDRMLRELAEQLVAESAPDGWILIGGIAEVADVAFNTLPKHDRARAHRLVALDVHNSDAQIAAAAESAVTAASRARDAGWVEEVMALSAANGKGLIGWKATHEALQERAVDRLLFTDRFLREHPVDVERAVALALEQHAEVEHVSGPGAENLNARGGGIGAYLRFLPTREQAPLATQV